ncbi:MAG: DUF1257 domain-containing protein [Chloroflexi bacterium]|nr:DUF1257 domain-containing protein [Chloroflexota bacterium]
MSHFTRVRTKLRNLQTVQQALEEMGYNVDSGAVRGYAGMEAQADLVVKMDGRYDIGFRKEDDTVVMVADFWGLRIDRDQFMNELSQRYAYMTVVEQAETGGWQKVTEEVQEDGSIRLVIQRWN